MAAAGALAFVVIVAVMFVHVVPKDALTRTDMRVIGFRLDEYVRTHGQLPPNLAAMPSRNGKRNRITDAWDRPLRDTVEGDTITLASFGADGKPGGSDLDADLSETFILSDGGVVRVDDLTTSRAHPPTTRPTAPAAAANR